MGTRPWKERQTKRDTNAEDYTDTNTDIGRV